MVSKVHKKLGIFPIYLAHSGQIVVSGQIEWRYFRLDQIQDRGWQPFSNFQNGHIFAMGHPIH